jgi:hypothetical protein
MDVITLALEIFGFGSLVLVFTKYTLERRKEIEANSNMKNNCAHRYLIEG